MGHLLGTNLFISIHLFIQQIFTENLQHAKLCLRGWGYRGKQNRIKSLPCRVDILVGGEKKLNKINKIYDRW